MSLEALQAHARTAPEASTWARFGALRAAYDPAQPRLVLLNYTHEALFAGEWNPFERLCRGLILDQVTGQVVARPFDKFFNYGESYPAPTAHLTAVYEKLDGSLLIGYLWDKQWRMASRGSLTGPHAAWGGAFLARTLNPRLLNPTWTLLFEGVGMGAALQDNLVVQYDRPALCLLAVRNRLTGAYLPWAEVEWLAQKQGWRVPVRYAIDNMAVLLARAEQDALGEGYVAHYSDGSLFKVKTAFYLRAAYLKSHFNKAKVWAGLLAQGPAYADGLPDDVRPLVSTWANELAQAKAALMAEGQALAESVRGLGSRKAQAAEINKAPAHLRPMAFRVLDGKSPDGLHVTKYLMALVEE